MKSAQLKEQMRAVLRAHKAGTIDETTALGRLLVLNWELYAAQR